MGRPLQLHNAPLRNLAMLRDEFLALAGGGGDARFAQLTVQRAPLVKEGGEVDLEALNLLSKAFCEEKDLLVVGDWAHDPTSPSCYHEFLWGRGRPPEGLLDLLNELAEAAVRSIASVEGLAARLKIDQADLIDNLAWDSYWLDLLLKLGQTGAHPVVRTVSGAFRFYKRFNDTVLFYVGDHFIPLTQPPEDLLRRMRKLATAKSEFRELRCGVLRGSAYAIDWLMQEVEANYTG